MKSKLYKTHRKPSYYRLRRLGYVSISLVMATLIIVLPLTFTQASDQGSSSPSTSQSSSETVTSSSDISSETQSEPESEAEDSQVASRQLSIINP
jgi:cytoskeletal protein RodZ